MIENHDEFWNQKEDKGVQHTKEVLERSLDEAICKND